MEVTRAKSSSSMMPFGKRRVEGESGSRYLEITPALAMTAEMLPEK